MKTGYTVRTCADFNTDQGRKNGTTRRDQTLANGAARTSGVRASAVDGIQCWTVRRLDGTVEPRKRVPLTQGRVAGAASEDEEPSPAQQP